MTMTKVSSGQRVEASRVRQPRLAASRPLRRGFTLVEMVVVIGIIVLLVGLTVGVLTTLNRGAEVRTTENMLKLLDTAYAEWKLAAERDMSYGVDGQPQAGMVYEIQQDVAPGDGDDHEATDEVLEALFKNSQSKTILGNIDADLLVPASTVHPETTARDAWDVEIITVFPGRVWVSGFDAPAIKDEDGTIRTAFENVYGMCVNRRVRFVSAGPDARFGDLTQVSGNPLYEQAKDNVYSYPLEAP